MCGTGRLKPKNMIKRAKLGCFPELYNELSNCGKTVNYVITL